MTCYFNEREKSILVTSLSMARVTTMVNDHATICRTQAIIYDLMRSTLTRVKAVNIAVEDMSIIMQCLVDYYYSLKKSRRKIFDFYEKIDYEMLDMILELLGNFDRAISSGKYCQF